MTRFAGRVALVTGAASGVGRAIALRFARDGADVVVTDLNEAGLAETAAQIEAVGVRAHAARGDVTSRSACGSVVASALDAFSRIDFLCNSAGVNRFHHFDQMPEDDWHLILAVNLTGVAFMCQAALPALLEAQGSIVNVASVAGLKGQPYTAAYCASKGGVVQLTRALAAEYIERGIRVNAVAPGGVDTPMNEGIQWPDEMNWDLMRPIMGKRGFATADQVAEAVTWLASDDAKIVHGAILAVDQGITAT